MLRAVVTCALLAACEPHLQSRALPELVKPEPMGPIKAPALMFVPGETMTWRVSAKGLTLGMAQLAVDEHEVRSRFETGKLVSAFSRVRHELATVIGPGVPRSSTEILEVDGETTRVATMFSAGKFATADHTGVVPGGNSGHTLHSALGLLRAWARPNARPGYFYLLHAGEMYRVDVGQPFLADLRGEKTLRIECRVAAEEPVSVTMWLRDGDWIPLRIEISSGDVHATAELVATEES